MNLAATLHLCQTEKTGSSWIYAVQVAKKYKNRTRVSECSWGGRCGPLSSEAARGLRILDCRQIEPTTSICLHNCFLKHLWLTQRSNYGIEKLNVVTHRVNNVVMLGFAQNIGHLRWSQIERHQDKKSLEPRAPQLHALRPKRCVVRAAAQLVARGRADAVNPVESLASGGGWGARQPQRPAGIPARARANPLDLRGSLGATTADNRSGATGVQWTRGS